MDETETEAEKTLNLLYCRLKLLEIDARGHVFYFTVTKINASTVCFMAHDAGRLIYQMYIQILDLMDVKRLFKVINVFFFCGRVVEIPEKPWSYQEIIIFLSDLYENA